MHSADHPLTREELMAYLDDEVSSERRPHVEQHLRECPECTAAAEEFRQVSRLAARWTIEQAPASLRAPLMPAKFSSRPRPIRQWLFGACAGAAAAVIAFLLIPVARAPQMGGFLEMSPAANPIEVPAARGAAAVGGEFQAPAAPPSQVVPSQPARQTQVTRTASLRIAAASFDQVRAAIERITANTGGFVERLIAASTPPTRAVHATLRIPAANLGTALAELRMLGQVIEDSQSSTDVTDQIVDLGTRLANARATEQRLVAVLRQSGKISDVLEVEREISRVRGEIEQLDAQRTNVGRQVAFATVTVYVVEEQRADIRRTRVGARLSDAVSDGFTGAARTIVDAIVLALRVGPTATLLLLVGGLLWVIVRRVSRGRLSGLWRTAR